MKPRHAERVGANRCAADGLLDRQQFVINIKYTYNLLYPRVLMSTGVLGLCCYMLYRKIMLEQLVKLHCEFAITP